MLVVGAGPTGLVLANLLCRGGFKPLVVERLAAGQNTSRAAVMHAHTLDVLDRIDVSGRLVREGLRLDSFCVRDGDATLTRLKFDRLPTSNACLLMIPQDRTEAILRQALAEQGGEIRWGTSLVALQQGPDGVEAQLASPDRELRVRSRYVIGADGMKSAVREAVGIGFTGSTYEAMFVLADIDLEWPLGQTEVNLFFSPPGPVVVAPLPGGRFRVVASLADAPEHPQAGDIEAILNSRGPATGTCRVPRVHWSSRFRLHHRVADRYRAGRAFLIGDAAHVHSPAGGQGMNTGLVDAYVLGSMLVEVLAGRQVDAYLDEYEALRRPAAKKVLALAGRLTAAAMLKPPAARGLRNLVFRIIGALPPMRRRLVMNLSGLSRQEAGVVPGLANGAAQARQPAGGDPHPCLGLPWTRSP
ncbi:MAG: FAD-dependent monooxygenase [Burkholderiales bacterium]|nr:FAD-dependent monooxygenase [Burkholderiales bacterium]